MHFWQGLDYYHWLFLGMLILVIELLLGGGLLVWLGCAALVTGVLVLVLPWFNLVLGWQGQLMVFVLSCLLAILAWWRFFHWQHAGEASDASVCGQAALLKEPLQNGKGYLVVKGKRLLITGPDLPAGTQVRLVAVTPKGVVVEALKQVSDSE